MDFKKFADAVRLRYEKLSSYPSGLFTVDVDKDTLWLTYLYSFENDPVFRVRAEHDCSCCRHFLYDMGRTVALVNGKKKTVWDITLEDEPQYQKTADVLAELIRGADIKETFGVITSSSGLKTNRVVLDGTIFTFEHFHASHDKRYVYRKDELRTKLADLGTQADMFRKSLEQIKPDAVVEVLELISSNSLYRGGEHKGAVESFQKAQNAWIASKLDSAIYSWEHFKEVGPSVCSIKNTVIGTLLVDLSSGVELDQAVRTFESKVAPMNYKRPTALVTPRMVEDARAKLQELGLYEAMSRRYASLSDITINNVLFANRNVRTKMKDATDDLFDGLKSNSPKSFDRVDSVDMPIFLTEVLPFADSIEVFLENKQEKNLVSLVTSVTPGPLLFKWENPFSWSYNGDLADSYIKERVAAKGGNVTGDVCCRLAWSNHDDLDLHMLEQTMGGVHHIYYASRRNPSPSKGQLDVDANAGQCVRDPVENIYYTSKSTMRDGKYELYVNQYSLREKSDSGFTVEVDILGQVHTFVADVNPPQGKSVEIATLMVKNGDITLIPKMNSETKSRKLWGLDTQQFHQVSALMKSPNHWEGEKGIGNLHYLFMLKGMVNEGNARGFYNEFLRDELTPHRKVLEMVGSRSRTLETPNQLSGVGFSSTSRQEAIVRVTGKTQRVLKVRV